jgi:hypothetical protein
MRVDAIAPSTENSTDLRSEVVGTFDDPENEIPIVKQVKRGLLYGHEKCIHTLAITKGSPAS